MSKEKSGFTLIEVLVVLAVVAILGAILGPVFTSARQKGLSDWCQGNIRRISLAYSCIASDHVSLPPRYTRPDELIERLRGYDLSGEVFQCPIVAEGYGYNAGDKLIILSYGVNGNLLGRNFATIKGAQATLLLCDWNEWQESKGIFDNPKQFQRELSLAMAFSDSKQFREESQFFRYPHWVNRKPGINTGYLDGHAKWHKLADIYPLIEGESILIDPEISAKIKAEAEAEVRPPITSKYIIEVRDDGVIILTPTHE